VNKAAPVFGINTATFKHLYPFKSHYLDINGLPYHYLDEGRGEPIIMVHGNPTWSFYFRNLVLALRDRYRVIVPDHIGCGLSAKPDESQYSFRLHERVSDLKTLIDHLALTKPVTLILHDWGGMIGLAWCADHQQHVKRLVITNTAGFFPPGQKSIPWRLKLIRKPNPVMTWCVLKLNLFARAAIYMAPRHRLAADVKAGLLAPYHHPRHRLATLKFVQDIPLSPHDPGGELVDRVSRRLERICSCPTLVLWGSHDFVFDLDYYNTWRKRLPWAQAYCYADAGHYLFEDAPRRTIERIKDFLRKHP
jgi:pimeloyl-ACP methyl ester carboxylesterase